MCSRKTGLSLVFPKNGTPFCVILTTKEEVSVRIRRDSRYAGLLRQLTDCRLHSPVFCGAGCFTAFRMTQVRSSLHDITAGKQGDTLALKLFDSLFFFPFAYQQCFVGFDYDVAV